MIIEIESYLGDKLLSGKKCTEKELREKFKKALKVSQDENFLRIFCSMFKFEGIPFDENIEVDYVIDLDTHLVYTPDYN